MYNNININNSIYILNTYSIFSSTAFLKQPNDIYYHMVNLTCWILTTILIPNIKFGSLYTNIKLNAIKAGYTYKFSIT